MRMECAGHVVEGVLKERSRGPRRTTTRRSRQGRRAAIAEEDRPDVFTMRVGNIAPGERVTVRLTLAQPLPYQDGEVTFRFPLVVAPRYIPGSPLGGRPGRQRRGRRHRRRPRRLPDQPPGAAARVPQPGPAHAERRHRSGRAAAGEDPLQPARHRGAGRRRRPHDRPAAAGRAAGPGLHPAAGRGRPGPGSDLAGADPGPGGRPGARVRSPSRSCRRRRAAAPGPRRGAGRSTAPAACAAGRWWRPAAPPHGSWTR